MRKKTIETVLVLAFAAILLDSCGTSKRLTYFQDMEVEQTYEVMPAPDAHIKVNDQLKITVTASSPALTVPFNRVSAVPTSVDSNNGTINYAANTENTGYLVDLNGEIDFPVLGKIKAEGLTLHELESKIENLIVEKKFIKEPKVLVTFGNFQITMLGEIGPGNYIIETGSINIIEAIAKAGDLRGSSKRNEIWVIRTENGFRKVYTVDITSKSIFDSPVYNLQQNDIIYVKPTRTKGDDVKATFFQYVNFLLSIISTTAMVYYWTGIGKR